VTRRPNPKGRGEQSSRAARTTKRWKAFWFSEKRSPSREALERRPWPPRQAKHHLLSKGAAARGAAEETPILSRQRDGDEECSTGKSRRGAHAMREPFTHLRRPRKVPGFPRKRGSQGSASLAVEGVRFRRDLSGSLRMRCLFGDGTRRQRKRTTSPARGATVRCGRGYWRSRVCPYVESSLQKSVGGDGLKKRPFPTLCLTAREWRERRSSPRKTILASCTRAMRVPATHQRKLRSAASASREAVGDRKPKVGNVMCKVTGPAMVHDR
jgi:hypothetical protein